MPDRFGGLINPSSSIFRDQGRVPKEEERGRLANLGGGLPHEPQIST